MRFLLCTLMLIPSIALSAEAHDIVGEDPQVEYPFSPSRWTRGIHLLYGIGVNSSRYRSGTDEIDGGVGLNLKTDLGYYVSNDVSIELGVNVNFNETDEFLLWQSLFTIGARVRLPQGAFGERSAPYLKIFGGYGPHVALLDDDEDDEDDRLVVNGEAVERIHSHGPAAGANLGILRQTLGGTVWFIEVSGTVQWLNDIEYIRSDREIPVVLGSSARTERSTQTTLYFSIGLLAF